MSEALVLALEGSSVVCSAALLELHGGGTGREGNWAVVARRQEAGARGQAKITLRLVDEMLEEIDSAPQQLSAVLVGTGPGTFTGVRITVAAARAMSLALSVPVLGVSSLGALAAAYAARDQETGPDLVAPVIDAHRGQLFYGLYWRQTEARPGLPHRWVRESDFGVCERGELGALVVGSAQDMSARHTRFGVRTPVGLQDLAIVAGEPGSLTPELPTGVVFEPTELRAEWLLAGQDLLVEPGSAPQGYRLAHWLTAVLRTRSKRDWLAAAPGRAGTPEAVTPIYVRAPDADVHITKMRDPWGGSRSRPVG